ncbi:MAG TPA: response regulator transcription factor [Taishania sp.]|nr:response regulator transcription factor [Taishania sp.]
MKVVIADGNNLMRIGLRTVLNTLQSVDVVAEAKSCDDLLECLKNFKTDVLIIDYTSENFEIDVIPKVLNKYPELKTLAITPEQSAQTLVNALRSGVQSYVKKDCDLGEILDAVKETGKGNKFFCGQILETIQRASIDVNDIDLDSFTCEPISLSEREMQIIKLIAEGLTNTQIAEELFLSNHTINTHRKNILSKLGVKNTAGIVMYAVKTNLVSPNKFLFAAE